MSDIDQKKIKLAERILLLDYDRIRAMIMEWVIGCCIVYKSNTREFTLIDPKLDTCGICQIAIDLKLWRK